MNPTVDDPEFPRLRELLAKRGGRGTEAAGRIVRAGYTVAQLREWSATEHLLDGYLLDLFGIGPTSVTMIRAALTEMDQEKTAE